MRGYLGLILVAAVVAVGGAVCYGFTWSVGQDRADAVERMSFEAQQASSTIYDSVRTSRGTVERLAAQPALAGVFDAPADCTLTAEGKPAFPSVRLDVVRADGTVACSSTGAAAVPGVHAASPWLTQVLAGGTVVAWNATDDVSGRPSVVVATPVMAAGSPAGAVALFLHVAGTATSLAENVDATDDPTVTLVERPSSTVLSTTAASESGAARSGDPAFVSIEKGGEWAGLDGTARLFGSSDVTGSDWRVYVGAERGAVLADSRGALLRQALVGLLALVVLGCAVWVLNRRVAGPLRAVTRAVVRASRDPHGARLNESGTAELVVLTREFNSMLDVRAGHEAQLLYLTSHDALTGLPNRYLLRDQLGEVLNRTSGAPRLAVLFCGVNRFKVVNDGLGHDGGDRLLVEVAARLASVLTPTDTLARFGGDEFVVLSRGSRRHDAVATAERLQSCFDSPFLDVGLTPIVLAAAIGIAVAADEGISPAGLLREAGIAMRQAKGSGAQWLVFDEALHAPVAGRLEQEHSLRRALRSEELALHYQPLHDVASGLVVGAEALVRWQHPQRGMVPPMDFIPLAEETGQIIDIGRYVLTRACRQAAAWAAAGHPLRMSVNVAVDQLRHDDFPRVVEHALVDAGLPADRLCLEITESSLMHDMGRCARDLDRLRRLGVHLAIDDFGTGYSSLSYLHRLPVDELKIDRSFVGRLDHEVRDQHLVEAIIAMARALDLQVVAEGVENDCQLDVLARFGCRLAQGYLFAAPGPAPTFLRQLRANRRQPVRLAG